jgi:hypothetical protein
MCSRSPLQQINKLSGFIPCSPIIYISFAYDRPLLIDQLSTSKVHENSLEGMHSSITDFEKVSILVASFVYR